MRKFDIVIQAGQSNAEGTGFGEVLAPYTPNERIFSLEAEKTVEYTDERGIEVTYHDVEPKLKTATERISEKNGPVGDFSLTFAEDYLGSGLLEEGRDLLIIRAAIGATGFFRGNWGVGKQLHNKMLELTDYALGLNPENRLVGLLWHQGEHEIARGTDPEEYKAAMIATVADVRRRYNTPELPFIFGDFCQLWRRNNQSAADVIFGKLCEAADTLGTSAAVSSEGLLSNAEKNGTTDDIHFCRESLYELGHRYFAAYEKVKKRVP